MAQGERRSGHLKMKRTPEPPVSVIRAKTKSSRKRDAGGSKTRSSSSYSEQNVNSPSLPNTEQMGEKMMQKNWMVQTPYGVARVRRVRFVDGRYYYDLALAKCNGATMTTCCAYPSIEPKIGSEVALTCFKNHVENLQHGRVLDVRPRKGQVVVRLVNWQLAQTGNEACFVTCYLSYSSVQVVAPKPLQKMSVHEKLLYVHECRTMASQLFDKQLWKVAVDFYESALEAACSLLYVHTACVQPIRANIILSNIKVCNQASRCCWNVRDYIGTVKFSMNSLRLLHILEVKGKLSKERADLVDTEQISIQYSKLQGEVRVFASWRIKSLTILAQALMKLKQWLPAKQVLQQGHKIILKYTKRHEKSRPCKAKDKKENKRRIAQLYQANRLLLRLYAKVERKLAREVKTNAVAGPVSDSVSVVTMSTMSVSVMGSDAGMPHEYLNDDETAGDWPPLSSSLLPGTTAAASSNASATGTESSEVEVARRLEQAQPVEGQSLMPKDEDDDEEIPGFAGVAALARMFESSAATPLRVSSLSYPGTLLETTPLDASAGDARKAPHSSRKHELSTAAAQAMETVPEEGSVRTSPCGEEEEGQDEPDTKGSTQAEQPVPGNVAIGSRMGQSQKEAHPSCLSYSGSKMAALPLDTAYRRMRKAMNNQHTGTAVAATEKVTADQPKKGNLPHAELQLDGTFEESGSESWSADGAGEVQVNLVTESPADGDPAEASEENNRMQEGCLDSSEKPVATPQESEADGALVTEGTPSTLQNGILMDC